jgi:hypothetical protein
MATLAENGWPSVQHRGGPPGFLHVLDDRTLGFADFRGNRQYISVGNLSADDRAALILADYPNRQRLKILGHVELKDLKGDGELSGKLALPGYRAKVERAMLVHLETFDWNRPQHITPRFTQAEPIRCWLRSAKDSLSSKRRTACSGTVCGNRKRLNHRRSRPSSGCSRRSWSASGA